MRARRRNFEIFVCIAMSVDAICWRSIIFFLPLNSFIMYRFFFSFFAAIHSGGHFLSTVLVFVFYVDVPSVNFIYEHTLNWTEVKQRRSIRLQAVLRFTVKNTVEKQKNSKRKIQNLTGHRPNCDGSNGSSCTLNGNGALQQHRKKTYYSDNQAVSCIHTHTYFCVPFVPSVFKSTNTIIFEHGSFVCVFFSIHKYIFYIFGRWCSRKWVIPPCLKSRLPCVLYFHHLATTVNWINKENLGSPVVNIRISFLPMTNVKRENFIKYYPCWKLNGNVFGMVMLFT